MKLFREEVRAAQAARRLGSERLHRLLSFALVTGVTLAIGCVLVAFAAWGEVNRKARMVGLLVPTHGSLNISAPQASVLVELPVTEGQSVQADQVLLMLQAERKSRGLDAGGRCAARAPKGLGVGAVARLGGAPTNEGSWC